MKTKVWFEKNLPETESGVHNGGFLQRRYSRYFSQQIDR